MEFHLDRHSDLPFEKQIQDQVRMATLVGALRKGDALPSIRDVEKQTGVNRGAAHRAYQALAKTGMISLIPGKGAIVTSGTISPHALNRKCELLSRNIFSKVRRMGLSPAAFVRYLQRHALQDERDRPSIVFFAIDEDDAKQWAARISQIWGTHIKGVSSQQLQHMLRTRPKPLTVVTHQMQYHLLELIVRRRRVKILSISAHMTNGTMRFLRSIKPDSSVLMIQPDELFDTGRWPNEGLELVVKTKRVHFSVVPNRKILRAASIAIPTDYIFTPEFNFKNLPAHIQGDARTFGITLELEPDSLETARIKAGVII